MVMLVCFNGIDITRPRIQSFLEMIVLTTYLEFE